MAFEKKQNKNKCRNKLEIGEEKFSRQFWSGKIN